LLDIIKLIEGELLELPLGGGEGQSGRRVRQAWGELRSTLEKTSAAITLEQLAARSGAEMYYI
jgi:Rrf2 family transcriptional regulator, cysteine metabolism repressor